MVTSSVSHFLSLISLILSRHVYSFAFYSRTPSSRHRSIGIRHLFRTHPLRWSVHRALLFDTKRHIRQPPSPRLISQLGRGWSAICHVVIHFAPAVLSSQLRSKKNSEIAPFSTSATRVSWLVVFITKILAIRLPNRNGQKCVPLSTLRYLRHWGTHIF